MICNNQKKIEHIQNEARESRINIQKVQYVIGKSKESYNYLKQEKKGLSALKWKIIYLTVVDTIQGAFSTPLFFAQLKFNLFKETRNGVGWDSTGLNGIKM